MSETLPPIPAKRYFTLGEVCFLLNMSAQDLLEWEAAFCELRPRRVGLHRRVYQHHELIILRRLRHLLVDESFSVAGLRRRLREDGELSPTQTRQALGKILRELS